MKRENVGAGLYEYARPCRVPLEQTLSRTRARARTGRSRAAAVADDARAGGAPSVAEERWLIAPGCACCAGKRDVPSRLALCIG